MAMTYTNTVNTAVNTLNKDLFVPEVYGALTREVLKGKIIVSQFAEHDATLQGTPGETINVMEWRYIGDAADHTPGEPMDTTQLKQRMANATVKMVAAPGIEVWDTDDLVALGNQINEGAEQQAIAMARKLDDDCIDELLTASTRAILAEDGKVTFDELIEAESLFGDDFNVEDVDAILIHSKYKASFIKMEGFVNRDLTYVNGDAGIQRNNCIGTFMGVPVIVTDRLERNGKHPIIILKKSALKVFVKEAPFAESERDASRRVTRIYLSDYYAVKLVKDDAVVVLEK